MAVLLGNGIFPSEIKRIEIFTSDQDDGNEKPYQDLIKTNKILEISNQTKITEFLEAARKQPSSKIDVDFRNPNKVYHIILWKSRDNGFGYGRLLIFKQNNQEYGFIKASDGTTDFVYNGMELANYIRKDDH